MQRGGPPAPCRPRRQHQGDDRRCHAPRGPDQLILRPYTDADLSGLLTCWEAAIRSAEPQLPESFILSEIVNIRGDYLQKVDTLVADQDGVAGFICVLESNVAALFVRPQFQGQGIGTALVNSYAPPLQLEVFEANLKARAFYHRRGFRPTGARTHEETGFTLLLLALDERGEQPLYAGDGQERRE